MDLITEIKAMAELFGKELSPAAATMYVKMLSLFDQSAVFAALEKCRNELGRFPVPAEVISRIDDGRPSIEEAWAMVPRKESDSVYWTDEMREAFFAVAAPIIDSDEYGARKAFEGKYRSIVTDNRMAGRKPSWEFSPGFDKNHRVTVLREALEKKRISFESAKRIAPEIEHIPNAEGLKITSDIMRAIEAKHE